MNHYKCQQLYRSEPEQKKKNTKNESKGKTSESGVTTVRPREVDHLQSDILQVQCKNH